jgi:hypothetical protein
MTVEHQKSSEIGLIDIWDAAARHRLLVFCTMVIVMLVAVAYLTATERLVESHLAIRIGKFSGKPIADAKEISSELRAEFGRRFVRSKLRISDAEGDSTTLILTGTGSDRQEIARFLSKVSAETLAAHDKIFNTLRNDLVDRRQLLQRQIEFLKKVLATVDESPGKQVVTVQADRPYVALIETERQLADVNARLADPTNRQSIVTHQPETPPVPWRASALILAASLFLGLLVGLFAAVGMEIVRYLRAQARARDAT